MNRNHFYEIMPKDEKSYYNCHYVTIDDEVFVIHETVVKGLRPSDIDEDIAMWITSGDASCFKANYKRKYANNGNVHCISFPNNNTL